MRSSPLAIIFGSQPDFLSLALAPDGDKVVFIQHHPNGGDFVRTVDLNTVTIGDMILSSPDVNTEIDSCAWANHERLLCSESKRYRYKDLYSYLGRTVALNYDGQEMRVLRGSVIDLMPEDPRRILIQTERYRYSTSDYGEFIAVQASNRSRVSSLDIYTGKVAAETYPQAAHRWISDGHGVPRLYQSITKESRAWYVLESAKRGNFWKILHETKSNDLSDRFSPVAFADNANELLYLDSYDGRTALFSMDLANEDHPIRLVFAQDRRDVLGVKTLGKHGRAVAATYVDGKLNYFFFDEDIRNIHNLLTPLFPGQNVKIVEEDWNRRFYIITVTSDINPGVVYRYDSHEHKLARIASISSKLKDRKLAAMREIRYRARDGVSVPAFLTLPDGNKQTGLPTVILPHGGPSSLDSWGFDPLVQFLAANGYVVLQSNYRGSAGYGDDWYGDGAFRDWQTAVSDINDGTRYLIDQGIADQDRICIAGWSYGGYAAMMSAIENPTVYKCVASIAGVSDPRALGTSMLNYVGGLTAREFIGADAVGDTGSPVKRAAEISVPVLLVHAQEDANVPFNQSEGMYAAMVSQNKKVEFIQYERADHNIKPEKYRIDLFTRLAEFLDQHTK